MSLYIQNHEESPILRKTITNVSDRLAQYRVLARPTVPNSIDANFSYTLNEVEAQICGEGRMQQMQFNGQWPSSPTPLYFLTFPFAHMRRCQIKVQFKSGAKTKFLESLFKPETQILNHQNVPLTRSFQNVYNTYMWKMHLKGEKSC